MWSRRVVLRGGKPRRQPGLLKRPRRRPGLRPSGPHWGGRGIEFKQRPWLLLVPRPLRHIHQLSYIFSAVPNFFSPNFFHRGAPHFAKQHPPLGVHHKKKKSQENSGACAHSAGELYFHDLQNSNIINDYKTVKDSSIF